MQLVLTALAHAKPGPKVARLCADPSYNGFRAKRARLDSQVGCRLLPVVCMCAAGLSQHGKHDPKCCEWRGECRTGLRFKILTGELTKAVLPRAATSDSDMTSHGNFSPNGRQQSCRIWHWSWTPVRRQQLRGRTLSLFWDGNVVPAGRVAM